MSNRHAIAALVENEFGVLARIAGLFSSRGYNIQSLTVAETLDPKISRMTITTEADPAVMEQIMKQLRKLVNVIKVQDVTAENPIIRILALVKLRTNPKKALNLRKTVQLLKGRVLEEGSEVTIAEFVGDENRMKQVKEKMVEFEMVEFEQTGSIAMERGKKVIKA